MHFKKLQTILVISFGFLFSLTIFYVSADSSNWVQFGAGGKPSDDWSTAEKLLDKLNANGVQATEIDRWKNSGWDGHIKDFPFNDFEIKADEGYYIKVTGNADTISDILNDYSSSIPDQYNINSGWNLINFPKGFKNKYNINTAEDLCSNIGDKVSEVGYANTFDQTVSTIDESPNYKSHECGATDNNFEIDEAHVYMIVSSDYSDWTPTNVAKEYFLFWGPKGVPGDNWNRAEELLDKLASNDINAIEINRWKNSGWDGHVKDLPFNDFEIKVGEGYLIKVTDPDSDINDVLDSWSDASQVTYDFAASWNLVSFPNSLLYGKSDISNASDLCGVSGVTEVQYAKPYEKGTEPVYTNYECNENKSDFTLEAGRSYFVKSSKNTSFNLKAEDKSENKTDNNTSNKDNDNSSNAETKPVVNTEKSFILPNASNVFTAVAPSGTILGLDITTMSFYDSLLLLLSIILLFVLLVLVIVFIFYYLRKNGYLPSIRDYIKSKAVKVLRR